jgi:hypothetical protein
VRDTDIFLPGIPVDHVLQRLSKAGGKELESGKLLSSQSSAALAVNTFGWFVERPDLLPPLPGLDEIFDEAVMVDIEYCARFPWAGGRHPWLDAVVETPTLLIGIESKRYEPFRDRKSVSLSDAYDRPVWGKHMTRFERMRDELRAGLVGFRYLDAAQLVKHAFGLVTDARRRSKQPVLYYLFSEPRPSASFRVDVDDYVAHRMEIIAFHDAVDGDEVNFRYGDYSELLLEWEQGPEEVALHGREVMRRFWP